MRISRLRRGMVAITGAALVASLAATTAAAPAAAAGKVTCEGKVATIVGTNKRDVIYGTKRADIIAGLGGNDVIIGRGGNDIICGGKGADRLVGKAGFDRLYGNGGPDRLFGGNGPDKLFGGVGNDVLAGQAGNDLLNGGLGTDRCYQGSGIGSATSCELPPAVLAIAYSDLNGNHAFDSGDVMISKLVDTNGDHVPSVGDTIVMGRYPLNVSATAFGDWGVKSHVVTVVNIASGDRADVDSSGGPHRWVDNASYDVYVEGGIDQSFVVDSKAVDAGIQMETGSPSQPSQNLNVAGGAPGDKRLIDVELYFLTS